MIIQIMLVVLNAMDKYSECLRILNDNQNHVGHTNEMDKYSEWKRVILILRKEDC